MADDLAGTRLESRTGSGAAAVVLFLALAALSVALAGTSGSPHPAIAAIPLVGIALALIVARPPALVAQIRPEALVIQEPPTEIRYDQIESLTLSGLPQHPRGQRLKPGALVLMHTAGVMEIPQRLNMPVERVYAFLAEKIAGSGARTVHPRLAGFVTEQEAAFGPERVWTFAARQHLGRRPSTRRGRACCVAIVLSGLCWMLTPLFLPSRPGNDTFVWFPIGIILAVFGALIWLVMWSHQRYPAANVKEWRSASLVISPGGVAMIQGSTQGHLRWDEVLGIASGHSVKGLQLNEASRVGVMAIRVHAADIHVADIYDRPLWFIQDVLTGYWRPG